MNEDVGIETSGSSPLCSTCKGTGRGYNSGRPCPECGAWQADKDLRGLPRGFFARGKGRAYTPAVPRKKLAKAERKRRAAQSRRGRRK
jgi:hypothetical protein